jgi:hypothetical protein
MLCNILSFALSYFTVGGLFATNIVILQYYLKVIGWLDNIAILVFLTLYGGLLLASVVVALAVPIDKSMGCWKFIGTALGAMFLITFIVTCWLLSFVGFSTQSSDVFFLIIWFWPALS